MSGYSKIAEALDLTLDEEDKVLYGEMNGFPIAISSYGVAPPYFFMIYIPVLNSINNTIINIIKNSTDAIVHVRRTKSGLCISVKGGGNVDEAIDYLGMAIGTSCYLLQEKGYEPCCQKCKGKKLTKILQTEYSYLHLCPECAAKFINKYENKAKRHYINYVLIMLLGSIILCLLMMLCPKDGNGYPMVIVTIIVSTLPLLFCEWYRGDKLILKDKIVAIILIIFSIFIGYHLNLILTIQDMYDKDFFTSVILLCEMLETNRVVKMNVYISKMVTMYVCGLFGIGIALISLKDTRDKNKSTTKQIKIIGCNRE